MVIHCKGALQRRVRIPTAAARLRGATGAQLLWRPGPTWVRGRGRVEVWARVRVWAWVRIKGRVRVRVRVRVRARVPGLK